MLDIGRNMQTCLTCWIFFSKPSQNSLSVHEEFIKRKFTAQKTKIKFSKVALNHNQEQMNAKIKGVGGAIGLTENKSYLQRWLICGPEIERILDEFEGSLNITSN